MGAPAEAGHTSEGAQRQMPLTLLQNRRTLSTQKTVHKGAPEGCRWHGG